MNNQHITNHLNLPFLFLLPTDERTGTSTSTSRLAEGLLEAARELVAIAITSSSSSDMALVLAGVNIPDVSLLTDVDEPARGVATVVGGEIGALTVERVERVGRDIVVMRGISDELPPKTTLQEEAIAAAASCMT